MKDSDNKRSQERDSERSIKESGNLRHKTRIGKDFKIFLMYVGLAVVVSVITYTIKQIIPDSQDRSSLKDFSLASITKPLPPTEPIAKIKKGESELKLKTKAGLIEDAVLVSPTVSYASVANVEGKETDLWLENPEVNKQSLQYVIRDSELGVLYISPVLKPGEYVENPSLSQSLKEHYKGYSLYSFYFEEAPEQEHSTENASKYKLININTSSITLGQNTK